MMDDIRWLTTSPQAEKVQQQVTEPQTPNLNVAVSVSFPQSEIFGVKVVNGHATEARLSVTNNEIGRAHV